MYCELSEQCDQFALDLLSECRTTEEVEQVVHKRDHKAANQGHVKNFDRVKLAFDYNQRLVRDFHFLLQMFQHCLNEISSKF